MSEERFDSLEEKMIGIQEALARTSSCVDVNKSRINRLKGGDEHIIEQLRKELTEKNMIIQKMKVKSETLKQFRDSASEIEYLKGYLSDKIASINQMKEELHRMDRDRFTNNTREVVRLEAKISNYHQDIINISERLRQLISRKEKQIQNSLNTFLTENSNVRLISVKITKEVMKQTKLRYGGCGLEITTTVSDNLAVNDRIVEVNGESVLNIERSSWHDLRKRLTQPYMAVIMRVDTEQEPCSNEVGTYECDDKVEAEENAMQDNIALIQKKLEMKLKEGGNVKNELKKVKEERDKLQMENLRLNHRISYLEEMFVEIGAGKMKV